MASLSCFQYQRKGFFFNTSQLIYDVYYWVFLGIFYQIKEVPSKSYFVNFFIQCVMTFIKHFSYIYRNNHMNFLLYSLNEVHYTYCLVSQFYMQQESQFRPGQYFPLPIRQVDCACQISEVGFSGLLHEKYPSRIHEKERLDGYKAPASETRGNFTYYRSLSFNFCLSTNPADTYLGSKERGGRIKSHFTKTPLLGEACIKEVHKTGGKTFLLKLVFGFRQHGAAWICPDFQNASSDWKVSMSSHNSDNEAQGLGRYEQQSELYLVTQQ